MSIERIEQSKLLGRRLRRMDELVTIETLAEGDHFKKIRKLIPSPFIDKRELENFLTILKNDPGFSSDPSIPEVIANITGALIKYTDYNEHFKKIADLKAQITEFRITDFSRMGRLFGREVGQFPNIGEFEKHLQSLLDHPFIKDAPLGSEGATEKEFLMAQRAALDQYKPLVLAAITRSQGASFKDEIDARVDIVSGMSALESVKGNVTGAFEAIKENMRATVNQINEAFESAEDIREARRELATAVLKIGLGVIGAGAVGEIISQTIKQMNILELAELTGEMKGIRLEHIKAKLAEELGVQVLDEATENMLHSITKVLKAATGSKINDELADEMAAFLDMVKIKSCAVINKAVVQVKQTKMTSVEWEKELNAVNQAKLLSMNPNEVEAMAIRAGQEMQEKVKAVKEKAAVKALAELPKQIQKVNEIAAIDPDDPHYDELYTAKMDTFTQYFKIHFLTSVLSREYSSPHAIKYAAAPDVPKHEGFEPMIRKGHVKHFPEALKGNSKLLMLFEPDVLTGKFHWDQTAHKGGKPVRLFLATKIPAIKDNLEAYGFAEPGVDKHGHPKPITGKWKDGHKGVVEDVIRSYTVIVALMAGGSGHGHGHGQQFIPALKEDKEIFTVVKALMQSNVFFATHAENKGEPLITPLCVFNRDKQFTNLIENSPALKRQLAEEMLSDNFILKCLTDPNIKDTEADKKRLNSTLSELIKVLESTKPQPELTAEKIAKLKKEAEHYIDCQCAKASISEHREAGVLAVRGMTVELHYLEKNLRFLPEGLVNKEFKNLLDKLIATPNVVTSRELKQIEKGIEGIVGHLESKTEHKERVHVFKKTFLNVISKLFHEVKLVEELDSKQRELDLGGLSRPPASLASPVHSPSVVSTPSSVMGAPPPRAQSPDHISSPTSSPRSSSPDGEIPSSHARPLEVEVPEEKKSTQEYRALIKKSRDEATPAADEDKHTVTPSSMGGH